VARVRWRSRAVCSALCALAATACASPDDAGEPRSSNEGGAPGGVAGQAGNGWYDPWAAGQAGATAGAPAIGGAFGASGNGAGTGGEAGSVGVAGGGAGTGTTSGAGSTAPMPPASDVTTYTVTLGPVPLAAGEETVVCTTVLLGNEDEVFLPRIRGELQRGSHHFIAYRSVEALENPTPTPCTSFAGVFASGGQEGPLMIVERPTDTLQFPPGVALKLAAKQMLLIELHAINTTTERLEAAGTFHFDTLPLSTQVIESNMAFWGTLAIAIPPSSPGTTGVLFQPGNPGTKAFALTTHQHRLGTRFRVWASDQPGDTSKPPIAETLDWSNPPLYRLEPEVSFDGTNGLSFQCDWENTTDQLITFGESALQEMCFLWMYYYPSVGFDARFF
jgi:hypothetical protein